MDETNANPTGDVGIMKGYVASYNSILTKILNAFSQHNAVSQT